MEDKEYKSGPCIHGNPCRESMCVEYGRWDEPVFEVKNGGELDGFRFRLTAKGRAAIDALSEE